MPTTAPVPGGTRRCATASWCGPGLLERALVERFRQIAAHYMAALTAAERDEHRFTGSMIPLVDDHSFADLIAGL